VNLEGVFATNWKDVPAKEIFPGIRKRILWQGANGAEAQIVEIDAGATFTTLDIHAAGPEEVFVVSGVFSDGVHDYRQALLFTIPPVPHTFRNQKKAA
jgi:hypothetical protein